MSSCQSSRRESRIQKPPAYWDNLSTIWLTRGSLRELRRRLGRSQQAQDTERPSQPVSAVLQHLRSHLREIQRSARHGGFDLSDLRGYPRPGANFRTGSVTRTPKSKKLRDSSNEDSTAIPSTPYSLNFEQHLIDNRVYPPQYFYGKTRNENEPENLPEIRSRLATRRPSLSPSSFSEEEFEKVQAAYCTASKEPQVLASVIPFIEGTTSQYAGGGTLFKNLAPLTEGNLTKAKPDIFYGAHPEELDREIPINLRI